MTCCASALAEEVAAPSKAPDDQQWDNKGCSALKVALKNTVLPDAGYLAQLADEGGILPRNQDLPPGSRVTLADMEKWDRAGATVGGPVQQNEVNVVHAESGEVNRYSRCLSRTTTALVPVFVQGDQPHAPKSDPPIGLQAA